MSASTALMEAQTYHDPQRFGFFSLGFRPASGQFIQESYPLFRMPEILADLPLDRDVYIGQNEFQRPNRRAVNLLRIPLCYVDLDTYRAPECEGLTPQQQAQNLRLYCDDYGVPQPSLIVSSGGGLQAKWLLDTPLHRAALPRWNAVQGHLTEALKPFGADGQAKDAGRVLRAVGTYNVKRKRPVELIYPDAPDCALRWDFETLAYEVLLYTREEIAERRAARQARKMERSQKSARPTQQQGLRRLSAARLWWTRLEDLRTLLALRGWQNYGVPEGHRNTFMLISSCALSWNVEPDQFGAELTALWQEFCPTLTERQAWSAAQEVQNRLRRSAAGETVIFRGEQRDPRYHYRNGTLIDLLEITPAEQTQLRTIIGKSEAARRHRARNHRQCDRANYVNEVSGAARERTELVVAVQAQGMSIRAIAEQMNVSIDAVKSLLKRHRAASGQA